MEALHIEQLLVQDGVEHFHLAVVLLVLSDHMINAHLGEQRREMRDPSPRPERGTLVAHGSLWPAMPLERLAHHLGPLRALVDTMSDDVARVVVDQNQRERHAAIDVAVNEVQVPQMIRSDCFVPLVMRLSFYLRRPVPGVLHHAPRGVYRHLDPVATKLVDDLAWTKTRVLAPLRQDLTIALRLDVRWRRTARWRWPLALDRLRQLTLPVVDRERLTPNFSAAAVSPFVFLFLFYNHL